MKNNDAQLLKIKTEEAMFQKHSVFRKLLIKYLYVAILPFLAVTAVMCFLMCAEFKKNEVASAMYELNEYVSSVNFEN